MATERTMTAAVWALGAVVALILSAISIWWAQDGQMQAWALVSFVWSVAMLAGFAHHLGARDALTRYRERHKPLAGPREGAQLPS